MDLLLIVYHVNTKSRKMITIVDPHIKIDDAWDVYKEAKDASFFVVNKDKGDYDGWCWPGSSMWIDTLSDKARQWWGGRFAFHAYIL